MEQEKALSCEGHTEPLGNLTPIYHYNNRLLFSIYRGKNLLFSHVNLDERSQSVLSWWAYTLVLK